MAGNEQLEFCSDTTGFPTFCTLDGLAVCTQAGLAVSTLAGLTTGPWLGLATGPWLGLATGPGLGWARVPVLGLGWLGTCTRARLDTVPTHLVPTTWYHPAHPPAHLATHPWPPCRRHLR